jgi:hypothetical protein
MSLRALGRQFAFHVRNFNKGPFWPGYEASGQGRLFLGSSGRPGPSEAEQAANRSWMAGKKPASWGGSWWGDYHPVWDPQTGKYRQPPEQQSML